MNFSGLISRFRLSSALQSPLADSDQQSRPNLIGSPIGCNGRAYRDVRDFMQATRHIPDSIISALKNDEYEVWLIPPNQNIITSDVLPKLDLVQFYDQDYKKRAIRVRDELQALDNAYPLPLHTEPEDPAYQEKLQKAWRITRDTGHGHFGAYKANGMPLTVGFCLGPKEKGTLATWGDVADLHMGIASNAVDRNIFLDLINTLNPNTFPKGQNIGRLSQMPMSRIKEYVIIPNIFAVCSNLYSRNGKGAHVRSEQSDAFSGTTRNPPE